MSSPAPAIFGQPDGGGPFAGVFNLLPMEKVVFGPGSVTGLAEEIDRVGGTVC